MFSLDRATVYALAFVAAQAVLTGCSLSAYSLSAYKPGVRYDLTVSEPHRMRFYGKGAGAGMMLTSSMGPMGVAIGVAIDEGIGKDFESAAVAAGFNIETLTARALESAEIPPGAVSIQRYGFVTRPGEGDPVAPQLHLRWGEEAARIDVKYPEDFDPAQWVLASFEEVKSDGALAVELHAAAGRLVAQRLARELSSVSQ